MENPEIGNIPENFHPCFKNMTVFSFGRVWSFHRYLS